LLLLLLLTCCCTAPLAKLELRLSKSQPQRQLTNERIMQKDRTARGWNNTAYAQHSRSQLQSDSLASLMAIAVTMAVAVACSD